MTIKRITSQQPIPPHAKKVFEGKFFDTYQWEQQLYVYDGTVTIFEKIRTVDTVSVIPILENGKILICRQKQPRTKPFVSVFGGRIDKGESPLQAAKRELLEETGYSAKKLILWNATQLFHQIEWTMYTYIAKGCKKVTEPHLDGGEHIELMSVSPDAFISLATKNNFRGIEIALKLFRDKNAAEMLRNNA